jgi:uncharacterized protein HemX
MEDVTVLAEEAVEVAKSGKKGLVIGSLVVGALAIGAGIYFIGKKMMNKNTEQAALPEQAEGTNEQ